MWYNWPRKIKQRGTHLSRKTAASESGIKPAKNKDYILKISIGKVCLKRFDSGNISLQMLL